MKIKDILQRDPAGAVPLIANWIECAHFTGGWQTRSCRCAS